MTIPQVKNRKANRLINEKSPYLLQHAYNPVNWYPWCDDAFEKAKAEDKPIFLSIGYSSCHWCHVMENECFEDKEVADILNTNFISIKVDREERPDIDSIYMSVCQALTGSGGWPLSLFLTPEKKPFYAGTYFPKESKYGRPGLIDLLSSIIRAWQEDKAKILNTGDYLVNTLNKNSTPNESIKIEKSLIKDTSKELFSLFDYTYGGFGTAPKFPTPHNLSFLLKYSKAFEADEPLQLVEKTLIGMYKGGLFDHIGFGFSRYSTDQKWLIPHFEKMLYDNALLAYVYIEAYDATKNDLFKQISEKIFQYIFRVMTSSEGGFYSAEDADSEGIEGKFYIWTPQEVKTILGNEDGELYCSIYDIKDEGNFEGKSIPNLIASNLEELQHNQLLKTKLENMRKRLFEIREKRIHPFKDDKILTSWNGLMIAALAYGGRVFKNSSYTKKAEQCVDFIKTHLVKDGKLQARYRDGEAMYDAYLEDYAFLTWGLIELYQTTFKVAYLKKALEFNEEMLELFWDPQKGGLYLYSKNSEALITRPKEVYDGAIPSGNSVAAHNMLLLYHVTGNDELLKKANELFNLFSGTVRKSPMAHTHFISAYLRSITPHVKAVVAGEQNNEDTLAMLAALEQHYNPFKVILLNNENTELHTLLPTLKNQNKLASKATTYLCNNFTCQEPITDVSILEKTFK